MAYTHDPSATLDYYIDWSPWLATGETITTATWTYTSALAATVTITPIASTTKPGVWVSGATLGDRITLTCHATTSAARQDDRSLVLAVRDR